ncbi:hypothetical protein [Afifella aestuarii]|uniref:hypothetical protein n=1 Tax=Afifella aestuarii TaxID=1909496 RepID=UPI000FE3DC5E|nr:hypothetical protein [Afifella aestuarii]
MIPSQTYPSVPRWLGFGVALSVIGIAIGWFVETQTSHAAAWFAENGPVEWPQAVFVALAAALFLIRAMRSPGPIGTWCIPIAYLLACAIVREMPACESHTFDGGACIERSWKAVLFSGGAAVAFIGLFWRRDDIAEMIRPRWFLAFWPLGIAALLLFIGEAGEDFHHEGVEEMLEFAAYLYALCFGVWVLRYTQSASVPARPDLTGFQAAETRGAPQSHPHPQG